MKKITLVTFILLLTQLFGCATQYGYSQSEWESFTPKQQERAKQMYLKARTAEQQGYVMDQNEAHAQLTKRLASYGETNPRETEDNSTSLYGVKPKTSNSEAESNKKAQSTPKYTGDLLNVTVAGGKIKIYGKHRYYDPISFQIQREEQKQITLTRKDRSSTASAWVNYKNGTFSFDVGHNDEDRDEGEIIPYLPSWVEGNSYIVNTGKRSDLESRDITVTIQAVKLNE